MFLTPLDESLLKEMRARLGAPLPARLGVAVSGGSDSLALMVLLAEMARQEGTELCVATVDHGLRRESRAEALQVAAQAQALGLTHDILTWTDHPVGGNLQGEARAARYRLLVTWSRARGAASVAVGHTADDQAETVLMRLRRASGVTGLAAMTVRSQRDGVEILRPLLGVRRADLRRSLLARGMTWIDDPSNCDDRFERVRMRNAMEALAPLGLTVEALSQVAENMQRADLALDAMAAEVAARIGSVHFGAVRLDLEEFRAQPAEVGRRLILAALAYVGGGVYAPRREALEEALLRLARGQGGTLQGCRMLAKRDAIWITREWNAVRDLRVPVLDPSTEWDGAWLISFAGAAAEGVEIRPLGADGLKSVANWRDLSLPREVLLPLPSLWKDGAFLLAPMLQFHPDWACAAIRPPATWASGSLSH